MFGEEQVKKFCATLLSEEIQDECDKTGLKFVGRGRITDFSEMKFTGGKPHTVDIECDLWPEMTYSGATGYKGLKVTASKTEIDIEKYEKVKRSIMERYKVQGPTDASYAATMGDVVVGSMTGYEEKDDGSKGPVLPSVASGTSVDIALETGKYMPGLVEGLVGAKAGDVRTIRVQFPVRPTGAGAALSGKKAIFDVAVSEIKTQVLPDWNEALATRIRPELTLKDLETEVTDAVQGERAAQTENLRNDAIAKALHDVTIVSKIPESLVEETTMNKFQTMLSEFKEQGTTEEQLREMATPENYEKYRGISKANVERTVILSMAFADIAAKENIAVTSEEIKSQLDLFAAQAKQKGDKMEDTKRVSEEIENTLLRKKVFDFLASHADITWVEAQVPPAV